MTHAFLIEIVTSRKSVLPQARDGNRGQNKNDVSAMIAQHQNYEIDTHDTIIIILSCVSI